MTTNPKIEAAWTQYINLKAKSYGLYAESYGLQDEAWKFDNKKLYGEASKLRVEAYRLWLEGYEIYRNAAIEAFGKDTVIDWDTGEISI
jgi:hypothetical protein